MIYFIQSDVELAPIKIGYAESPSRVRRRLSELRVASPFPLTLIGTVSGTRSDEKFLHMVCHRWRLEGEWFRTNDLLTTIVESIISWGSAEQWIEQHCKRRDGVYDPTKLWSD